MPSSKKHTARNSQSRSNLFILRLGGKAATVAGYGGPGLHTWPPGHIPQDNSSESAFTQPGTCSKDVRRCDRGQRPTATEDPNTKQRHRRQRRHCSWGRWPRFPQLAPRPHPSRHGYESAFTLPVTCQKSVRRNVRRRDRGQRPTATKNPNPKQPRRRQSRAVAGYAGPGFHNWPPGHILQDTDPNPLLRSRSPAQKTFGAATGVSDPRLQKTRIRNNGTGGNAATVAGDAGPGFHNWPPGHIPQDTDTNPLLRCRSPAKKAFGETFGAATAVSDPRLQKTQIRNNHAGGKAAL